MKVDAYIPDIHRQRDPRFAEQERFKDKKKVMPPNLSVAGFTFIASASIVVRTEKNQTKRNQANGHHV